MLKFLSFSEKNSFFDPNHFINEYVIYFSVFIYLCLNKISCKKYAFIADYYPIFYLSANGRNVAFVSIRSW